MKRHLRLAATVGILLNCATLWGAADPATPDRYFWVGGAYVDPDETRGARFGVAFAAGYAGRLGTSRWWELRALTGVLETDDVSPDHYHTTVGLDLLQPFGFEDGPHFFGLVGAGVALNDVTPDSLDGSGGYANAGLGWRGRFGDSWGLRPRVDLRYQYDRFDSGRAKSQGDLLLTLALEVAPKRERIVVEERIVERVVEKIVEKRIEVPVERIVEKRVEIEPADSDGDGVYDPRDQCPNTLAGATVDEAGCVRAAQTITLPNIEFASGKAQLTEAGQNALTGALSFLRDQPDVALVIGGHTDNRGSAALNQALSARRAAAVRDYLVGQGIAAERLESYGFGSTQPVTDNDSDEGRARNRRVELHIRPRG